MSTMADYILVIEPLDDEREQEVIDLDCAWCLHEQGIDPTEGSHGICTEHAEEMLSSYRGRRARG